MKVKDRPIKFSRAYVDILRVVPGSDVSYKVGPNDLNVELSSKSNVYELYIFRVDTEINDLNI